MRHWSFVFLILLLPACSFLPRTIGEEPAARTTGISGRVTDRGGDPVAGAEVYAYRSPRGGLRGPADFSARTEADGSYFLDLVEGNYYLVARWRREGGGMGPPRAGDAWALFPRNPVGVEAGKTSRADFRLQVVTQPALLKEGSLAGGDTGYTGRLIDSGGKPVAGAFALGYRDRNFQRMPDLVSAAADENGRFILFVPAGGVYCLAARSGFRGQPRAGELYGILGDGEGACRPVRAKEILDVGDLTLEPFRR